MFHGRDATTTRWLGQLIIEDETGIENVVALAVPSSNIVLLATPALLPCHRSVSGAGLFFLMRENFVLGSLGPTKGPETCG